MKFALIAAGIALAVIAFLLLVRWLTAD